LVAMLALGGAARGEDAAAPELVVRPGELVDAKIEKTPARLHVASGRVDRLTLAEAFVAKIGVKPGLLFGKSVLSVAGRQEFTGYNRPLNVSIGGISRKSRAFWLIGAAIPAEGQIGPWSLPQTRVTFRLRPSDAGMSALQVPLLGSADTQSLTGFSEQGYSMGVLFDLDSDGAVPVASAAAGAAIAKNHGGTLSGASWDVEILFGVKRPVRLMTLQQPLVMGPLRFTRIAVRVRDRFDSSGAGDNIREADDTDDPSEIVVQAGRKGPKPIFSFSIPRASLAACSRLTFDKASRKIELLCPAADATAAPATNDY